MKTGKGMLCLEKSVARLTWIAAAAAAIATGAVRADNEWNGDNIVNNSLTSADIRNNTVQSTDIRDGTILGEDMAVGAVDGTRVLDDSLGAEDLGANSVSSSEIATDAVAASEIQDNSIDSGEIVDFSLTNQDVGVLFAQVSSAGNLDNSSGGGVSVTKIGAGTYEVDFARNISACAFVATIGPSGAGTATGEVNVADRSGNVEAVFVDTNNSDGAAADKPFHLIVVC